MAQGGSDSSMDDCNALHGDEILFCYPVQIPLWTIVTAEEDVSILQFDRSDSSMDDCNEQQTCLNCEFNAVQIPLWTIVTPQNGYTVLSLAGSDSSMDDCNPKTRFCMTRNTRFRFLYGRL